MNSLWDERDAQTLADDPLALRVYSSRLFGQEPSQVLHGGGNTSVKADAVNLFGETESLIYVKGSGWDLATIEKAGLTQLARVAALEFGGDGIRVNVLHPNAVFDTAIWSEEVLAKRAASYGLSVEAYNPDYS